MKHLMFNHYNSDIAEKLVQQLLVEPLSPRADQMMNDLLSEFHRGYPLDNLRPLLHSKDQNVVKIGAWIASGLGEKGHLLLPDVLPLIHHPASNVRFSIIDCILLWGTDGAQLSAVTDLLDDPDGGVRWKAMDFLSRARRDQLQTMLSYFEARKPQSWHARGLRWLLSPDASEVAKVKVCLMDKNALIRKYGAVAATRMSHSSRSALSYALSVNDPDVQNFAKSGMALLKN